MTSPQRRKRVFADFKIQGILCVRIALYWVLCQTVIVATILAMLTLEGLSSEPASPWRFLLPAIVVSSIVLPIMLLDMLIFSNKFAGPLVRFRRHMHLLAEREPVDPLHFRPGDYYRDLSANFNLIREHLQENQVNEPSTRMPVTTASEMEKDTAVCR